MNSELTQTIIPLTQPPKLSVRVPGSKSITNRALILAALASHQSDCTLTGALQSEDTEVMIESLRRLGFQIDGYQVKHLNDSPIIPATKADLFLANSGTSIRFLTAMVALGQGTYHLDGIERMRERPIADLLTGLTALGVDAKSDNDNGCPPVTITTNGIKGGSIHIRGDVSSQYLSGLLMAAPLAKGDVTIHLEGELVSKPYVDMTVSMIHDFGGMIEHVDEATFHIPGNQQYRKEQYTIEPDASAASYFYAAAAITGGAITVEGLSTNSLQGDVQFVDVLEQMGCKVTRDESSILVEGGPLRGIDVDMNAISDTVMTLGAVACFADGPTTIRNVGHIRHKETDRLSATANELRRVGAKVELFDDGLTIIPQSLHSAEIETYNDHRMAMSLALVGLRIPGIVIKDPKCVGKTYPEFFQDLALLEKC